MKHWNNKTAGMQIPKAGYNIPVSGYQIPSTVHLWLLSGIRALASSIHFPPSLV